MPTIVLLQVHLVALRGTLQPPGGQAMEGWEMRMGAEEREAERQAKGGRESEGGGKKECKSKCRFVDTVRRACWLTG